MNTIQIELVPIIIIKKIYRAKIIKINKKNILNLMEEEIEEVVEVVEEENYLSGHIGINENSNDKYDEMFNIIDSKFSTDEVQKHIKQLNINIDEVFYSVRDFYDKKLNANKTVEYTDFVSLVVYPRLIKNTHKKSLTIDDKFILLLFANNTANDAIFYTVNTKSKELVVRTFITRKTIGDKLGKYLGKDFLNLMMEN